MIALEKVESTIEHYCFPAIDRLGFQTFVTGRYGGVSRTPYKSLNTDEYGDDSKENVTENLNKIIETLPIETLVMARQVHSDTIIVTSGPVNGEPLVADGIATKTPSVAVAVRTADCVPLLFADEKKRVAAAVHAGRAGVEKQIAAKAVVFISDRFSGVSADSLVVAIGPHIRSCCYEVDDKSAVRFHNLCGGADDGRKIDLLAAIRAQLIEAGVKKGKIIDSGVCTSCHTGSFFSYRKEGGKTGRFLSGIAIRPVRQSGLDLTNVN